MLIGFVVFLTTDKAMRIFNGGVAHDHTAVKTTPTKEPLNQAKASAWLCIITDFTHNITDGLAISASFYMFSSIGAVTTMAVFFHGNQGFIVLSHSTNSSGNRRLCDSCAVRIYEIPGDCSTLF